MNVTKIEDIEGINLQDYETILAGTEMALETENGHVVLHFLGKDHE